MRKLLFWIAGIVVLIVMAIAIGLNEAGNITSQFTGSVSDEAPLPDALVADLEKYVLRLMRQYDVPGAAMVLVQGDQVVYARGLGVSDLESKKPVTTQTLFGIGSSTKPMTSIMLASMVDEGVFQWDTPVTDIIPSFAVSNPAVSQSITFMHTLCMCTGVPRQIEAISVQYSELIHLLREHVYR